MPVQTIGSLPALALALSWGLVLATPALAADKLANVAAHVTIVRDDWGIAHIHGHTDADAVFGMAYAQAEDDFNRIEMNSLTSLGRMAEAEGSGALAQDLRARLYVDPADLNARYRQSPAWLQALMTGWAGGLNWYLATHPAVHPRVIAHFEPWMALAFTEGSIGGDIEDIPLPELARFYDVPKLAVLTPPASGAAGDPTGSNGIAVAPSNTRDHHALLLINPHTSFYFRSELQMTSDEGLNAYGAVTWGQFFIYQGFNDRVGWMHTSSHSDAVDQFLETVMRKDGRPFTRYGDELRPVTASTVTLSYRNSTGGQARKSFVVYRTTHGPVVGQAADGRWIAEAMMFEPVAALEQSYELTRARNFSAYMKVMQLKANTSNNTVYADADGNIAYLHPQFIPRRDDRFDYTRPVDGADPRTDWHGLHALDEAPHLLDPATGWIQNTNDGPYTAAGPASPNARDFPRYMDTYGENVRGLHAVALLQGRTDFTLQSLMAAAYDPGQPGFDILIPHLLDAYDHAAASDPLRARLAEQIAMLRAWNRRWSADSVPTSLAVTWGEALWRAAGEPGHDNSVADYDHVLAATTPAQRLQALATATDRLTQDFGTWRMPWGQINRFQRLSDDLLPRFSDSQPSLPVGFTSAQWGSLASITGPQPDGVKRRYGNSGNSFVAVVEFGPRVRAVAVTAGGESGDSHSPHFDDQALRYSTGALRPVYFYPDDLAGHTARRYHPGSGDLPLPGR
ncbi:penicillin acylase family protein [Lichenicola sp.]|uniref:penicillin acylase family protein n=1 Tax=Lichenicola sp. TaxID=2804529 RepID=UPI003B00986A